MKRRSFLSAVVAGTVGLSGCTGLFGGGGTDRDQYGVPKRSPTATPTRTPEDDDPPDLPRVIDLEVGPRTYAVTGFPRLSRRGFDVEMGFSRTGTNDHPPVFAVRYRNTEDVPQIVYPSDLPGPPQWMADHARQLPEGSHEPTMDGEATLALVPVDRNDILDVRPKVARQGTYWRVAETPTMGGPDDLTVPPGESVVAEFALVGGPRTRGRPPGTYRFGNWQRGLGIAVWNSERPGPEADSRFDGETVAAPGERSVTWFHEADPKTPVYIYPSTERTDPPGLVEFHFVNHSEENPDCGGWNLYKRHENEWYEIDPRTVTLSRGCRFVGPGSTTEWSLRAYHGDPVPSEDEGLAVGYLGGGTYAVTAGYGDSTDATGALFEVEADPVGVTADEDVTVRRREGREVTVAREGVGVDEEPAATVTLSRSEESPERTFVAEQLAQPSRWGIRNALAFFEAGVDRVSFRTAKRPPVARPTFRVVPDRFAYDGGTYELSFETGQ